MPWVESKLSEDLKQTILDFPDKSLNKIYELLIKYKDKKNIIIFNSRLDADNYLNYLK